MSFTRPYVQRAASVPGKYRHLFPYLFLVLPLLLGATSFSGLYGEKQSPSATEEHSLLRVYIYQVLVDGKEIYNQHPQNGKLPPSTEVTPFAFPSDPVLLQGERNLSFRFGVAVAGKTGIVYRCRLEGHEVRWSAWTPADWKNYKELDYGVYRFLVQARDRDNRLSNVSYFSFKIPRPWYRTPWAYSGAVLLLGLLLFLGMRRRSGKLAIDKKELEQHIQNATREIELKNHLLEEQTIQVELQAQELQEMAEVRTRFFANVSHELRTPLTLIMGPLEQLMEGCGDCNGRKQLEMMHRNSLRLLTLINQLLALSRIDKGKMKLNAFRQDIVAFLKGILSSFQLLADQNDVRMILGAGADEIYLFYDPEKLDDVFCNLFLNVLNLTPKGKAIIVNAHCIPGPIPGVEDGPADGYLEISAEVFGLVLPHGQLDHIFDRFYLAEESFEHRPKGFGIGLALARELVSLHQGQIDAWRGFGEDESTVFMIRLPLGKAHLGPDQILEADAIPPTMLLPRDTSNLKLPPPPKPAAKESAETKTEAEAAAAEPADQPKNIVLIVEDNADAREFIGEALVDLYKVETAADGAEGIKKAQDIIPDLIISDIIMPHTDGYELCRVLKKDVRTSHIPIILLTARGGDADVLKGLEIGADAYVTKPFNAKMLKARIKNLIELRNHFHTKIERQMVLEPGEIKVSSIDESFIKELQSAIEKNLSDPEFNVDRLAKQLYMSRATLYRKVHALTGQSTSRFIRSYRLKRAAQLLMANFGNVGEVALEAGFSNVSHFTQCFKKQFHQLPSEFSDSQGSAPV